jgi:hypothetical protein
VIDQARNAPIRWDDVAIGFSRAAARAAGTSSIKLTVGLLSYWDFRHGKTLFVFASVNEASDGPRRRASLPEGVARAFRRALRERGFEPDGARSLRKGKSVREVGFDMKLANERDAVRVCTSTYDALLELPIR